MAFWDNLFSKSKVVIDLGTINIKVVEGLKKKNQVFVKSFGMASLSSTFSSDMSHVFEENLASILEKVMQAAKIKSKNFLFIVPTTHYFFTHFTLPRISGKNLPNAIKFEAQRYLPIKIDETLFFYRYLLQDVPGNVEQYLVFALAMPLNYQNKMENISKLIKGKVKGLVPEVFTLEQYFVNDPGAYTVVNIGHGYVIFVGIYQSKVIFVRKSQLGGELLLSNISQILKVSKDRAILHLKDNGFYFPPEESDLNTAANIYLKNLSLELKKFINEFEEKIITKVSKVYWSGGLTLFKGFLEQISPKLPEYQQEILNPAKFVQGESFQKLATKSSIFVTNIGALL